MGKFEASRRAFYRFVSLLIVALGSLLIFVAPPTAKAGLIAYFNFEDSTVGGPPDFTSEADQGLGIATIIVTNYNPDHLLTVSSTFIDNRWPTDADPPLLALGMTHTHGDSPADFDIPLSSPGLLFQDMTLSFALAGNGGGFLMAALWYSIDGGTNFINSGNFVLTPPTPGETLSLPVPSVANSQPLLVLRLEFSGGQSNGANVQNIMDNIRVEGTIAGTPSPTPTPTATATATVTATATASPTPTPKARSTPAPRPRPTPTPRL